MFRVTVRILLAAIAVSCWACSDAPTIVKNGSGSTPQSGGASGVAPSSGQETTASSGTLRLHPPSGWRTQPASSGMRIAQYELPHADSDSEDASLVIYYFGRGQGGSVDANLERWAGQMGQSLDKAHRQTITANGLNITLLDVSGTYTADMTPGSGGGERKPDSRMRAGVIETPAGPYFVKLVGSTKTVARWDQEFMSFIKSLEFK